MVRAIKVLLIVFAATIAATPLPRTFVERAYSKTLYPVIQPRLTSVSNSVPFALFDLFIIAGIFTLAAIWIARVKEARRKGVWRAFRRLSFETCAFLALVYLWFLCAWGLNYQRQPLRTQLDFQEDRISADALRALAERSVASMNVLYGEAHRVGWPAAGDLPALLRPSFSHAERDLGMAWGITPSVPKKSVLDFYFRRVSVDGVTGPFFLETLLNQTLLPLERPFTLAHEWSHLAGFADESEANFLAWLVCMRGPVPVQYSGWLSLYGTIAGSLPPGDRDRMNEKLAAGPRRDLRAISDRVRKYISPAASRAGYAAYDRFLRANRVEAGVRSYGEVLRLLLGTKFDEQGKPLLKLEN